MVFQVSSGPKIGKVHAATSSQGGHPPEFWAERFTDKLLFISGQAGDHVRQQAQAFKDRVNGLALVYIRNAIKSDRGTVYYRLKQRGFHEAAEAVLEGLE